MAQPDHAPTDEEMADVDAAIAVYNDAVREADGSTVRVLSILCTAYAVGISRAYRSSKHGVKREALTVAHNTLNDALLRLMDLPNPN